MDHAKKAKKLRDRAKECRKLADIMKDQSARNGYGGLAESYESLAKREEAMIGLPHDKVSPEGRLPKNDEDSSFRGLTHVMESAQRAMARCANA